MANLKDIIKKASEEEKMTDAMAEEIRTNPLYDGDYPSFDLTDAEIEALIS
jgi:hypothetical protein